MNAEFFSAIEDLEKAKAEASEKYGTTYFAAKSMG